MNESAFHGFKKRIKNEKGLYKSCKKILNINAQIVVLAMQKKQGWQEKINNYYNQLSQLVGYSTEELTETSKPRSFEEHILSLS